MKILKWLLILAAALVAVIIAMLFFALCYAIFGPRPPVGAAADRTEWLSEQATDIVHRSQEGFGCWRVAEFTINEADFRAYAAKRGCEEVEVKENQQFTPQSSIPWRECGSPRAPSRARR